MQAGMLYVSKLLYVEDYETARDVLRDVVMMQKNLYGARDMITADSMKLLASVHLKLGDVESAIHAFSIVAKVRVRPSVRPIFLLSPSIA
jgi:hypothetical protein